MVKLGFHLILYPLAGLFSAAHALRSVYQTLRKRGTTLGGDHHYLSFDEFNDLIGVEGKYQVSEKYGEG